MWSSFRNVGSAIHALGNVVAPPVDDDKEDNDECEDEAENEYGEELEEADDINSQELDDEFINDGRQTGAAESLRTSSLKKGFGFVGLIARALERNEDEQNESSFDEDEDDEEEVVELYQDDGPSQLMDDEGPRTINADPISSTFENGTATPPVVQEDDGWNDIQTTWTNDDETPSYSETKESSGTKMAQRPSIQRETGSVSPLMSSKKSLQSSPAGLSSPFHGSSPEEIVKSLQSKLPDLLTGPESSEVSLGNAAAPVANWQEVSSNKDGMGEIDHKQQAKTKNDDLPVETNPTESADATLSDQPSLDPETGPPSSPTADSVISGNRKVSPPAEAEETEQKRRSSKVSLSDARFLAEPLPPEELETTRDRWKTENPSAWRDPPISLSPSKKALSPDKLENISHAHSMESFFDDSSLSSVSSHGRQSIRRNPHQALTALSTKSGDPVHLSDSSPSLSYMTASTPKDDKSKRSCRESQDRFRAEPKRMSSSELLPQQDLRFVSTKSHKSPPPEPQRQASKRQWSQGSTKGKGESVSPVVHQTDVRCVVPEVAGASFDPPRNPRRSRSGDTPSIPETEPCQNREYTVEDFSQSGRSPHRTQIKTEDSSREAAAKQCATEMEEIGKPNQQSLPQSEYEDMRRKCIELEAQLKAACEAKECLEERLKEEEEAREAQFAACREKESRLLEAAAEEQEQVARELQKEMERRVGEISSLLEDQQRDHENDRAEWQELLRQKEESICSARMDEPEDVSAHFSSLLEDQQREHENDRAEWQELLRQAEEQLEALKREQRGALSVVASGIRDETEKEYEKDRAQWQVLLQRVEAQLRAAEEEKANALADLENSHLLFQQKYDKALRVAEEKLAQTLAILDEREEQIGQLKHMVKSMSDEINEHREGVQEVEDEVDELRHQNEVLQHRLDTSLAECTELHEEVSRLQSQADNFGSLKMELRLIKEDRERERMKSQSAAENAESSTAFLSKERDAALAELSTLRQQLAAAQADTEIARQDAARALKASENLQMALESIQGEREAELQLLEEQRKGLEESMAAAHAAALEATHEANEARVREVQAEYTVALVESRAEIQKLHERLESYRIENVQIRRSLDEAISRLQNNQEDVIDRTLMKNILLDWLTKHGSKEKRQILELMASLLHFTDEEKGRVHIGGEDFSLGKVVASVAAPLPRADVGHLEGSNVREKWVNFLLAETDD